MIIVKLLTKKKKKKRRERRHVDRCETGSNETRVTGVSTFGIQICIQIIVYILEYYSVKL